MPRPDVNRAAEMEVFVRAVELGGFSAAARSLGLTPSAVSKLVSRLESRLGARLIQRSTRRLQLTAEGETFHARARRALAELDEAERAVAAVARPRGRIRVDCNVAFGRHVLIPLMPAFLGAYPEVVVDLNLSDRVIDLLDERADVAIRTGPLSGGQLTARKLGESAMAVVAAPAYLSSRSAPRDVAELAGHNRIAFNFTRAFDEWCFKGPGGRTLHAPEGRVLAGDGETARELALSGAGIARLAVWHVGPDIGAGRLTRLLEAFNPGDRQTVHAVYVGGRSDLPARVRAFIDYLAANVDLDARSSLSPPLSAV